MYNPMRDFAEQEFLVGQETERSIADKEFMYVSIAFIWAIIALVMI